MTTAPNSTPPAKLRILVMDDEESICKILGLMLNRLGYEIECVGSGEAALERYAAALRAGQPFNAVILDLTVPAGMGGADAAERLRALDPGVRAIVSSGYSRDPNVVNYKEKGFRGVISKPFRLQDVEDALREALAAP
jgi:two-component system, cell cycle sensor histidine kinase and response regulator CckA